MVGVTGNRGNAGVLAANVRRARTAAGLSQQALADALGLDRSAVSKIETGRRRVESLELQTLATRLGRPPAWFLSPVDGQKEIPRRRLLAARRTEILAVGEKHGARNFRLFGSVARGDAGTESDIDLMVDLDPGRTLMDHAALVSELSDLLGCEVDVVTTSGLKDRLRSPILEEAVNL